MLDPDPLRYYLTAIAPESQRTTFDIDEFIQRNNSELIANLGNFFNRWQKIITDDFDRKVPAFDEASMTDADRAVLVGCADGGKIEDQVGRCLDECRFKDGLKLVMEYGQACNRWINDAAPWKTRKTDRERTALTMAICARASLRLATVMYPFLPFASEKVFAMFGRDISSVRWDQADEAIPAGTDLAPLGILFKKLDPSQVFSA
jgi:methionyl-tRNA synthetase